MTPIIATIRSILDAPAATLRAQEALQRTMTGRVYPQPPVMTTAHIETLRTVRSLWAYPTMVDMRLVDDVIRHLDSLLTAPVPTSHEAPEFVVREQQYVTVKGKLEHTVQILAEEDDGEWVYEGTVTRRSLDDWRKEYRTLDPEMFQSDQ